MSEATSELTRASIEAAHALIADAIHETPIFTSQYIDSLASQAGAPVRLFFKAECQQRTGAFKIRGATHALRRAPHATAVATHSSGNHAQALAFAARAAGVRAHIVMPAISTPSKIAATRGYGAEVRFSGSTETERLAVLDEVVAETKATVIPPFEHPHIIQGQGTMGLEMERQCPGLDAVVTPLGGGGMLAGVASWFAGTQTKVFGAEPSFQGADDGRRGLLQKQRITEVSTLTIADGLRTPVGKLNWTVISDPQKVHGLYAVSEDQIKSAMRLVLERLKLFVEPSAAVPLAAVLFNDDFRAMLLKDAPPNGWNIAIVLSGGNTTVEAISGLFAPTDPQKTQRAEGVLGINGEREAQNVPG